MRLFVAVELEAPVRAAASRLIARLDRRSVMLAPKARIGWVLPDRLHLTVRFIGAVDDEVASRIRHTLEPPVPVPPFSVHIEGVGTFPHSGAPRVVWAGVRDQSDSLARIEREISDRLEAVGIPREDRLYTPHLTLGRVREAAGLKAAPLLDAHAPADLGVSRVSAVTLFESRLSPKGPTYVPLLQTALARGPRDGSG